MLSMSKDEEICICIGTIIFSLVSILFSQVIKAKTLECVGVGIKRFVFVELWDIFDFIGAVRRTDEEFPQFLSDVTHLLRRIR